MAQQVDDGEQHVAALVGPFGGGARSGELGQFLGDFRTRTGDVGPIEPDPGGAALDLVGAHQRGEGGSNPAQRPRARFFCGLERLPVGRHRRQLRRVAEQMRVPAFHLVGDCRGDVGESEKAFILSDLCVENDLEEEVAKFLAQVVHVAALDRVGNLIRFLDCVRRDGGEVLRPVPVAPGGTPQARHDRGEAGEGGKGIGHVPGLDKSAISGNCRGMTMTRRTVLTSLAVAGATAALLTGCNNLSTLNGLNALTPGDGGVVRRVSGAAYGTDPVQRLDVYAPEHSTGPLPVVVFFYGGGWNSGYRGGYAFAARAIAARGFVVVVPDYRLVPAVRFPAFVDDAAAAIRWTVDHVAASGGDPARIAVAGHSAGAHIAMLVALDRHYLAAVGAQGAIKAVVGLAGPYDFLPFDAKSAIDAFGTAPEKLATQPMHFVRADAPPALLLTGDADDVVRPRNTAALAAALRGAGAPVEVQTYAGVGHIGILLALSKPFRGKASVLDAMSGFMHAKLG